MIISEKYYIICSLFVVLIKDSLLASCGEKQQREKFREWNSEGKFILENIGLELVAF